MEQMIAYCGLDCFQCPAYIATQEDSDDKRGETAEMWSKMFKVEIPIDKINCDGCKSGGKRLFQHCLVCEIRACAQKKGLENCGYCEDFACDRVEFVLNAVPAARENLERSRA